jgi:hypothetical protein
MKSSVLAKVLRVACCGIAASWLQACNDTRTPFKGVEEARDTYRCLDPEAKGRTYECHNGYSHPTPVPEQQNSADGISWGEAFDIIGALGAIAAGVAIGLSGGQSSQPVYPSYTGRGAGGSGSTITGGR